MRKTNYGTYAEGDELNENEKALNKIVECAELVGIEVIEGKTAISIPFVAEVMERLEAENERLKEGIEKIKTELLTMGYDYYGDEEHDKGTHEAIKDTFNKYLGEVGDKE